MYNSAYCEEYHATAVVHIPEWVLIKNPDWENYDENCLILPGQLMNFIAKYKSGLLLVEYVTNQQTLGTECRSNTLFFISEEIYLKSTEEYQKRKEQDRKIKAWITQALKNRKEEPPKRTRRYNNSWK